MANNKTIHFLKFKDFKIKKLIKLDNLLINFLKPVPQDSYT